MKNQYIALFMESASFIETVVYPVRFIVSSCTLTHLARNAHCEVNVYDFITIMYQFSYLSMPLMHSLKGIT